ncbi:hypothetical protein AURDEDRAFT_154446 [Auricularia subglabra TFB-10046 SS5]|uniref:F-box domain-containing protein n=1 Tax=Auricularia subglabra (strain TFB-10046 / SS5) TaxID=717982 RepID=J0WVI7_AURST|nr:hypothetical protein AURDEDRAFT_154446 [Auricularia subglabra TFB-10046 SS5]
MPRYAHRATCFDRLATELVELILTQLDGESIVRASAVCQRFRHLVTSSARLQYQIELALEGLVEDPLYGPISLPARIAALQRYKRCWNELQLPDKTYRVVCPGGPEEYSCFPAGGYLVDHSVEESAIRIATLPATGGELDWKEMPLAADDSDPDAGAGRHYSTIALQALNMLIVLGVADHLPDGNVVPKVSLLHAEGFGPHPLAAKSELQWPAEAGPLSGVNWESMGLCGRSLAITLQQGRICVVWDWLLGTPLLVYPLPPLPTTNNWLLLTERTFCWTVHSDREVVLFVRSFDEYGNVHPLGAYAFPRLGTDPFIAEVSLTTDDADDIGYTHRLDARYPFLTDARGESVLALTLVVLTHAGHGVRDTAWTFYALRSALLQQQAAPDEVVPWATWGPQATRLVSGEAQAIRGCRAVHASDDDEATCETSVLTFLPAKCRAARDRVVDAPSVVDDRVMFEDRVETRLPYLIAASQPDAGIGLPPGALSWWEDGRIVWTTPEDPRVCRIVSL